MSYKIVTILDNILGPHRQFAKQEYYYFCPFCHHHNPKLAVNVGKRKWQCWKCSARGGKLLSLLRKLDVSQAQIVELSRLLQEEVPHVRADQTTAVLTLPFEFKPLWNPTSDLNYRRAVVYLKSRGILGPDVMRYHLGYCDSGLYRHRIIVPSYDRENRLNFFIARAYHEGLSAYNNPPVTKNVVGFENQINWKHPIVIVEGVFDAMAVRRNAVPLFGKTLSKKLQEKIIAERVTDVYLALDNDAMKDMLRIAERFMCEGINVYRVELAGKDPSALGFVETQNAIRRAHKLTFNDVVALKMRGL